MPNLISRPVHAALDYAYAVTALALPKAAQFDGDDTARGVATVLGVGTIASSMTTRYEGGVAPMVPFNTHLKLDAGSALLALASPWLLGFSHNTRARNAIVGLALLELAVVALSEPDPE